MRWKIMKSPWIILLLSSPNKNSEMLFFSHYRRLNKQIVHLKVFTVLSTIVAFAATKGVFLILFKKTYKVSQEFRRN